MESILIWILFIYFEKYGKAKITAIRAIINVKTL